MEVWGFQPKNINKNQSHISFPTVLAMLVRHSQAQKCLQINPKPFQQVIEFLKSRLMVVSCKAKKQQNKSPKKQTCDELLCVFYIHEQTFRNMMS